jgi:cardiolipin synthase
VPPPILLFVLQLAAARGVSVRVYTNGPKVEAAILYHAQRSHYARLLAAGIELYETVTEYNHAKMLVVDEKTVLVGSPNMDLRSAHLNFEIAAVAVDAGTLARELVQTMERRRTTFRRITAADLPRQPWWRAIDGLCGLFSPLL